jgi:hypothetical protein
MTDTETAALVKRLRDLHDRLHCLVTPYGVYKTSHDKELECEAASHECWKAADRIEALEAALVPFAEEAKFALHRPPGPGYLKHEDWQRVRELADE